MSSRLLVLLPLLAAGCVAVEGFDPVGDVAAIRGSWLIDGATPTGQSCDDLGADRVRVTFMDGLRPVTHTALFFECRLQEFDTNEGRGAGAVVGAGDWTVRLDAIDTSGDIVAVGASQSAPVAAGVDGADAGVTQVIAIDEMNFFSATISAQFLVAGAEANEARCEAAGILEVELEDAYTVLLPDGMSSSVLETTREPCQLGLIGVRALPNVEHVVTLRSYDLSGALSSERGPFTHTPTAGESFELEAAAPIDF